MIPRLLLPILFGLFSVFLISFAVLMGACGIAAAAHDAFGARVLWWIAMGTLILLVIDTLLLLAALAVIQLERLDRDRAARPEDSQVND